MVYFDSQSIIRTEESRYAELTSLRTGFLRNSSNEVRNVQIEKSFELLQQANY